MLRTVLLATLFAIQIYDLDFTKAEAIAGPGADVWRFEMKDLRTCYGQQMPGATKGEIESLRIWMP